MVFFVLLGQCGRTNSSYQNEKSSFLCFKLKSVLCVNMLLGKDCCLVLRRSRAVHVVITDPRYSLCTDLCTDYPAAFLSGTEMMFSN